MSRLKTSRNNERKMGVLEMETEAEMESLVPGGNTRNPGASDDAVTSCGGMTNNQSRFLTVFFVLAAMVGMYLSAVDRSVIEATMGVDGGPSGSDHVEKKEKFHKPGGSFGGINNLAHPGGAKAAKNGQGIAFADIVIPKSNVGHAIPSVNRPNIVNSWGHYVHDEHRSPYASHLYDATQEELNERQQKYVEKMKKVREEWGAWDFRDPRDDENGDTTTPKKDCGDRSIADFSDAPYKDLALDEFPPDSWQADEEYVARFLDEAKKLVHRVKEGIYAEYGWPTKGKEGDKDYLEKKERVWKLHISDCSGESSGSCIKKPKEGIAVLEKVAFEGLVKKLLHSLMTNDNFFAVLGGHSAAAGHGNDFQQNRIITFHHLMEPVFDKLGMRLISRNMGMGGVGTLQFTVAGGDLYGETDILEWDSGMTEKGPPVDLFNKQAVLSGERVPIIMSDFHFNIMKETNGTAWIGKYIGGFEKAIVEDTTYENAASQPYAARWINEKEEKYNAICWEPRSDFTPEKNQKNKPGSQVSWHPGHRWHHFLGRRLALVLLEALTVAFERWEEGIAKEGLPLATSYWHVGESYKVIRQNLRTHITTPKDGKKDNARSECEKLIPWLPRLCRVQMHGFGMWTPRAHVDYDLLNIVHEAPNGYKPDYKENNAYDGFDLLPLNQAIPDGEIDVHAIAIATTSVPPDLDHTWIEEDSAGDLTNAGDLPESTEAPPPTRRWLREASELGFRKAAELFPPSTVVNSRILSAEKKKNSVAATFETLQLRRGLDAAAPEPAATSAIVPGRGWEVGGGWTTLKGYCDGSAQSECHRNADNDCLLSGHNDMHLNLWGDAMSGWLVFTVPKVREGIILARMEWWCGRKEGTDLTREWTEVNGGMTDDTTPWNPNDHRVMAASISPASEDEQQRERKLKKPTLDQLVPSDFEMDIAINGVITTMKREEWIVYTKEFTKNAAFWPLLNDETMAERDWDGEPVEVGIRFRSELMPKQTYCVSHVYYA